MVNCDTSDVINSGDAALCHTSLRCSSIGSNVPHLGHEGHQQEIGIGVLLPSPNFDWTVCSICGTIPPEVGKALKKMFGEEY